MFFDHLPQNRRLDATESEEIEQLIRCRGNKKLIQSQVVQRINKRVTLRDLSNMGKKLINGSNDLDMTVKLLKETYSRYNLYF